MVFEQIIISTVLVSLISLIGVVILPLGKKKAEAITFTLVSFSAGTLMGAAFFDLIPESSESLDIRTVLELAVMGILSFFIIEKFINWHHHHHAHVEKSHKEKPLGYLSLIGDGIHNFFDGTAIAAAFIVGPEVGITTTIAVMAHEIPQEIGDFSLLLYSGFTKTKAIVLNLLSALISVLGGTLFFYFSGFVENMEAFALSFTAGVFIYIAAVDLLPELQKDKNLKNSFTQLILIILGILLIKTLISILEHGS